MFAAGFTVRSGWATAVLLTGPAESPRAIDSRRIDLSNPAIPESRQPYHAGFGTARATGPVLSRLVDSVQTFGRRSVTGLLREYTNAGHSLAGVGIVVGSVIDPDSIANEHIRVHAREGQLFRRLVEDAALAAALPFSVWRERDLYAAAAAALRRDEQHVRDVVTTLRETTIGPWRAEHKVAAVAAWLVLAAETGTVRKSVRRSDSSEPSAQQRSARRKRGG